MDLLDSGTMMSLNEEKQRLEGQLAGVSKLEERLREVNVLLGMFKLFSNRQPKYLTSISIQGEDGDASEYEDDEKDDDID